MLGVGLKAKIFGPGLGLEAYFLDLGFAVRGLGLGFGFGLGTTPPKVLALS